VFSILTSMANLLDDAFELLETATRLEQTGQNRVEAATKASESFSPIIKQIAS
jgi:hypothetical protein